MVKFLLQENVLSNGYKEKHYCSFEEREKGYIVEFKTITTTDNNKWHKQDVISDISVERFLITHEDMELLDIDIKDLAGSVQNIIETNNAGNLYMSAHNASSYASNLELALPTNYHSNFLSRLASSIIRTVKNTFRPAIVTLNDRDISSSFEGFEMFKENILPNIYNCLLDQDNFDYNQLNKISVFAPDMFMCAKDLICKKELEVLGTPVSQPSSDGEEFEK